MYDRDIACVTNQIHSACLNLTLLFDMNHLRYQPYFVGKFLIKDFYITPIKIVVAFNMMIHDNRWRARTFIYVYVPAI